MAGRRRTIDRDRVLDVAEAIVREHGPAALTIGAVASGGGHHKRGGAVLLRHEGAAHGQHVQPLEERLRSANSLRIAGENPSPSVEMRAYMRIEGSGRCWSSSTMLALLLHKRRRLR